MEGSDSFVVRLTVRLNVCIVCHNSCMRACDAFDKPPFVPSFHAMHDCGFSAHGLLVS